MLKNLQVLGRAKHFGLAEQLLLVSQEGISFVELVINRPA
jgi:hypothetical protein